MAMGQGGGGGGEVKECELVNLEDHIFVWLKENCSMQYDITKRNEGEQGGKMWPTPVNLKDLIEDMAAYIATWKS